MADRAVLPAVAPRAVTTGVINCLPAVIVTGEKPRVNNSKQLDPID